MNRDEKAAVIDEVAAQITSSEAVFAVDYRGITVSQVAALRTKLRDSDTTLRVVKNSLSERAAEKAGADVLKPVLAGPVALVFVRGDAAAAAKALSDTARQLRLLEFKGGLLNGSALSGADVQAIARLPSREVLYAQLVGTVAAPLTGLARGLNALIQGLALQLQAIADQGLVSGVAPASDSEAAPASEATHATASESDAPSEPSVAAGDEPEAVAEAAVEEPVAAPEAAAAEPQAAAESEAPEPTTDETDQDAATDADASDAN